MRSRRSYVRERLHALAEQQGSPLDVALIGFCMPSMGARYAGLSRLSPLFAMVDITIAILAISGLFILVPLLIFHVVAATICYTGALQLNQAALKRLAEDAPSWQTPSAVVSAMKPFEGQPTGTASAGSTVPESRQARDDDTGRCALRPAPEEGAQGGVCDCCGQEFVERTRRRPALGTVWTHVLAQYAESGVCPRCANEYGQLGSMVRPWTDEEQLAYASERAALASTRAGLATLLESLSKASQPTQESLAVIQARLDELDAEEVRLQQEEARRETEERQRWREEVQRKREAQKKRNERRCMRCGATVDVTQAYLTDAGAVCDACFEPA